MRSPVLLAAAASAMLSAGGAAQTPGLENFTIGRPAPPPTAVPDATPAATPGPAASANPTATPTPAPRTTPTASPSPAATRSGSATPSPTPSPTAIDTPRASEPAATPAPVATGSPAPAASSPATTAPAAGGSGWPLWAGIALALAALAGAAWWWRGRQPEPVWDEAPVAEAEPDPEPEPEPAPPAAAAPVAAAAPRAPGGLVTSSLRPQLALTLRPVEAAIDTLRAALEFELTVANTGRGAAHHVAVEAWLLGAGQNPGEERAAVLAEPPGQLLTDPFALPPSARADLPARIAIDRERLPVISAGERRLFVPMLVVRVRYRDPRAADQLATAAFLVGAERAGAPRLAPLALDRGTRSWRTLDARPLEV